MKRIIKMTSWIMSVSLMTGFILIPTQPVSAAIPVYKYEWVAQSGTISPDGTAHQYTNLQAGQTIDLWLTITNRSGTTIIGKSGLPTEPGKQVPVGAWGIGTQNPQDGTPYFLDTSSFILNNNRFVYYDNENLGNWSDGSSRIMGWTIRLSNNLANGVYRLYVRPVSEYLAWTQQYKNGKTLPGTDSDIFWDFVVGSGTNNTYLTYTNQQYGFSFDYPQPVPPAQLILNTDRSQMSDDLLATIIIGVPNTGSANAAVLVWSDSNLNNVVAKVESKYPGYAVSYLNLNSISWTVLKGHQDYADANYEVRIGKLPNGYVVKSRADGWSSTLPDQRFLNSLKPISNNSWLTYTNYQYGFSVRYPVGWTTNAYHQPTLPEENVGFRPPEMTQDSKWGITIYDSNYKTIDEAISSIGSQWSDRVEIRENILLNGISAKKVTTTTAQVAWWYSVIIVFEHNGKVYLISNGAVSDPDYETFYNSFKFI